MAVDMESVEKVLNLQALMMEKVEQGLEEIKKFGGRLGETESAVAKINTDWNEAEAKLRRPAQGQPQSDEENDQRVAKREAFKAYMRQGALRMDKKQRDILIPTRAAQDDITALQTKAAQMNATGEFKAFGINDDTLGGYFVLPEIIQNEIIKDSVLYTPARDLARVQPTSANSVQIRYRKTSLAAQWVSETGTRAETTGQTYGNREINTHEMYAFVLFSRQQLDDEYFDLESDLQSDIAEQFGVTEGAGFVTGTDSGQPQGFLANIPSANVATAAGSGALTYADFVKTLMKLKPAYRNSPNCSWLLHQDVLSAARQLVDGTTGRPLLQELNVSSLANGWKPTILDKPYAESTDMPSTLASTNRVLAVGDFKKAYRFIDRVQMSTLRLEELYAMSGQVGLLVYKRVGGYTVLPEALAALKNS